MPTRLIQLMESLPASRVVLVGDLMIDRYVYGNTERLSPEAPVPVLHFEREELRLGGAGNVAANLAVLGARVKMVGIVGKDANADHVLEHLKQYKVDCGLIVASADRPTVCKMRLVGYAQHKNPQQMIRLDYEDAGPISTELEKQIIASTDAALGDADLLCIEDYNKGLLTPTLTQTLIARAKARGVPVIIDPANIPDYSKYAGATALKMNRPEAEKATGMKVRSPEQHAPAADAILKKFDLEAVVITLDRQGSYLATQSGDHRWIKTRERQVADGTGAGDMMLAMIAMARCGGAEWHEAVTLANVAGGLEVERFGVVPIAREEIVAELLAEEHAITGKQRSLEALLPELQRHRAAGKRIVFTNGCFDLIHFGHIDYFRFAKRQGDLLVVGVNTDAGIRRLKGDKRPIIHEHDRVSVLEELESIDYLVRFDEDTPINLIKQVKPDVLVKGADYTKEQVVGWDFVESTGGKVALAPLVDGRSTSSVIHRILNAYGKES